MLSGPSLDNYIIFYQKKKILRFLFRGSSGITYKQQVFLRSIGRRRIGFEAKNEEPVKMADRYYTLLGVQLFVYFIVSKLIFDRVNQATQIILDEEFHIPQGISYCTSNFSHWDPKITTLPGLYLVSSAIGWFAECNTYNLRFVNLIASCINLMLFSSVLKYVYYGDRNHLKIILQAFSLTILPPLYIYSHVYYTDTLSITFLLMFTRLCFTNRHLILILICGSFSVIMRQTNILWVALVLCYKILDLFIKSSRVLGNRYISNIRLSKHSLIGKDVDKSNLKRYYDIRDLYFAAKYHSSTYLSTFFKFLTLHNATIMSTHLIILGGFITFVYINGSIAVGDKAALQATLHLSQLFYFLIFYGVFGLPYVMNKMQSTLKLMFKAKLVVLLFGIIFTLIVHYNTLTPPYVLAHNKHYIFYIWNRWYGKSNCAMYLIPIYIFLLFSMYDNVKDQNCISFLLPYTVCLFPALALKSSIEIRYYLIPYLVIRLRFARSSFQMVMGEFLWYLVINIAAFFVFFNKGIIWQDYDYVQRITW